jgi:hypothetical protein
MIPLAGSVFPSSLEQCVAAIRDGLRSCGVKPRDVRATGDWPRLAEFTLDLSGAHISRASRLERAAAAGESAVSIEQFAVTAAPIFFEDIPVDAELRASGVRCAFSRSPGGQPIIELAGAESGSLVLEVRREPLETALKHLAKEAAARQGADVKSARIEFHSRDARSLGVRAEVTAMAFLMTACVVLSGVLEIDDQLNLRLRELATRGDGMLGNLASGLIRARLAPLEGRAFPLGAQALANLKVEEIRVSGGESLRIATRFTSAPCAAAR